jgi:hypothetical protein
MSRSHKKHVPRNNKSYWYRIKVYREKRMELKRESALRDYDTLVDTKKHSGFTARWF